MIEVSTPSAAHFDWQLESDANGIATHLSWVGKVEASVLPSR